MKKFTENLLEEAMKAIPPVGEKSGEPTYLKAQVFWIVERFLKKLEDHGCNVDPVEVSDRDDLFRAFFNLPEEDDFESHLSGAEEGRHEEDGPLAHCR
jgi:hypothetical protein